MLPAPSPRESLCAQLEGKPWGFHEGAVVRVSLRKSSGCQKSKGKRKVDRGGLDRQPMEVGGDQWLPARMTQKEAWHPCSYALRQGNWVRIKPSLQSYQCPSNRGAAALPGATMGRLQAAASAGQRRPCHRRPQRAGLLLSLSQRTSSLSGRGLPNSPPRPQAICSHPHALPLAMPGDTQKERTPEQEVLTRK